MTIDDTFNNWKEIINFPLLLQTLEKISINNICPEKDNVFKAFKLCDLKNCKAVFLGQDPYPQKGVATGILFGNSVNVKEEELSPSLQIIKSAAIDFTRPHNYPIIFDNTLESWAKQGILMINSAFTVETNRIGSHTQLWRPFVADFLKRLSNYGSFLFVLFGQQAQSFEPYINKKHSCIIKEKHPAFYARTTTEMPSDVFYKINECLIKQFGEKIMWYSEFN